MARLRFLEAFERAIPLTLIHIELIGYVHSIGISILDADERRFSGFYLRLSAKICVLFNLNFFYRVKDGLQIKQGTLNGPEKAENPNSWFRWC